MLCFLFFFNAYSYGQIANYISNGGFENVVPSATMSAFNAVYYWNSIDTNKFAYYVFATAPTIGTAPYCSTGFQYPRSGNCFILSQFSCSGSMCNANNTMGYPRNRLKQNLQAGKTYCAKYYVVNTNNNKVAIENYGFYFASNSIDTIIYCNIPLTYITPQFEFSNGVITDTLNWSCISGTFTATGNEKYMVVGNFNSIANTNTLQLNTPASTQGTDVYIDDVSCIALDLPAYAGPDIWSIPTTTAYIGRPQDVGIDEACMWYKLPNTTNAIDTAAGITITVAATTETYMVKQDICGVIKYDTVVVHASGVGLQSQKFESQNLEMWPNPASNQITIKSSLSSETIEVKIFDLEGRTLYDERLKTQNLIAKLDLNLLPGVYLVKVSNAKNESVVKKLVISN